MECALATLIACFSWANLYIDSGLSYQDAAIQHHYWKDLGTTFNNGVFEQRFVSSIGSEQQNPYGRLSLGYQLDFKKVVLSLEASHTTSLETSDDDGINAISINARWFPFR